MIKAAPEWLRRRLISAARAPAGAQQLPGQSRDCAAPPGDGKLEVRASIFCTVREPVPLPALRLLRVGGQASDGKRSTSARGRMSSHAAATGEPTCVIEGRASERRGPTHRRSRREGGGRARAACRLERRRRHAAADSASPRTSPDTRHAVRQHAARRADGVARRSVGRAGRRRSERARRACGHPRRAAAGIRAAAGATCGGADRRDGDSDRPADRRSPGRRRIAADAKATRSSSTRAASPGHRTRGRPTSPIAVQWRTSSPPTSGSPGGSRRVVGRSRTDSGSHPPLPAFEQYIKGLLAETPATAINYLNAALEPASPTSIAPASRSGPFKPIRASTNARSKR